MMRQMKFIEAYGCLPREENDDDGEDISLSNTLFKEAIIIMKLTLDDGKPAFLQEPFSYLCLGSVGTAYNLDSMKEYNITHIINATRRVKCKYIDEFKYLQIEVNDNNNENISQHFNQCFDFINNAIEFNNNNNNNNNEISINNNDINKEIKNPKILIHCYAGKSRCVTICCAYLIIHHKLTLDEALTIIRVMRPQAKPNHGESYLFFSLYLTNKLFI
jgi:predicted protein tyrosine phosphatase